MSLDGFSIDLHMTRFTFYPPGSLLDMLSNLTIRHCSRPADRASVEPPDPATDESGKCHSRVRQVPDKLRAAVYHPHPRLRACLFQSQPVSRQSI